MSTQPPPATPRRSPPKPDPVAQILQALSRLELTSEQILKALEPPQTDSLQDQQPDPVEELLDAVQKLFKIQQKQAVSLRRLEQIATRHTHSLNRIESALKRVEGPQAAFD